MVYKKQKKSTTLIFIFSKIRGKGEGLSGHNLKYGKASKIPKILMFNDMMVGFGLFCGNNILF